jgi:cyclophilin family peptidyl-prolyl cis-trans isomerase
MTTLQRKGIALSVAAIGMVAVTACGSTRPDTGATPPTESSEAEVGTTALQWSSPPAVQIDPSKSYEAIFKTEIGDFRVRLFPEQAPLAVNNFVFLARQGYYDNTTFHRVLPGFMAQGGDPTGTGGGGPGYTFEDEFDPELQFDRPGLLAMANRGPDTNGGQFFITYAPTPHLNGLHTIFGEVVEGADVLTSLRPRDPQANPDYQGDSLLSIEIIGDGWLIACRQGQFAQPGGTPKAVAPNNLAGADPVGLVSGCGPILGLGWPGGFTFASDCPLAVVGAIVGLSLSW